MRNQDFLDAVSLVSFMVGLANYEENLTQNDKAEIMNKLDRQTKDILIQAEASLDRQNEMLKEIIMKLDKVTTITEQLDKIKEDICDHYCKYPEMDGKEDDWLLMDEDSPCKNCPLNNI